MQAKQDSAKQKLLEIQANLQSERLLAEAHCGINNDETVVLGCYSSLGIGDGMTVVQALSLYQQILPYRQNNIKAILTFRPDNIDKFYSVIREDFKLEEIYVYYHGKQDTFPFSDTQAQKAKIVILVCDARQESALMTFDFLEKNSPSLCQFLKNAKLYINLATPFHDKRNCPIGLLNKSCEIISIKELFTPPKIEFVNDDGSPDIANQLGNIAASEMGIVQGQAGVLFDDCLVRLCQAENIAIRPEDFDNVAMAKAFFAVPGCSVVGYVQQLSALQYAVEVTRRTDRSPTINIISRQADLNEKVLKQRPFDSFSTIELYDNNGTLTATVNNSASNRILRVFNFSGLSKNDKRLYLRVANKVLGSGDSSYLECLATGKLFFWEVPTWKVGILGRLAEFCVLNNLKVLGRYLIDLNSVGTKCAGVVRGEYFDALVKSINQNAGAIIQEIQMLRSILMKKHSFATKFKLLMSRPGMAKELFKTVENPYNDVQEHCIQHVNNHLELCDTLFSDAIKRNDPQALKQAFIKYPFLDLEHDWQLPNRPGNSGFKLIVYCVLLNPNAKLCFRAILNKYSDYGKETLPIKHLREVAEIGCKLPRPLQLIYDDWERTALKTIEDKGLCQQKQITDLGY
jgi:hypothetical protein